ncbi:MAG: GntR family transcriptional regulator [Eubacterium sp.]|nr:GntR family transcriptional regulator [Eubacterium sp.]
MHIIINHSSMIPIYEQIVDQIKTMIVDGALTADTCLPSVRALAGELKISALTVKKAYDALEQDGFTVTVHGKGTFVKAANQQLLKEEQKKEVEQLLEQGISKGRRCGITDDEMRELFQLLLEEE